MLPNLVSTNQNNLEIALGFPETDESNIHEDLPKALEWTVSYA